MSRHIIPQVDEITLSPAWRRGVAAAKEQVATIKSWEDTRDWSEYERDHIDPPVFCHATNCALTVTGNGQYCWRHEPAEDPT